MVWICWFYGTLERRTYSMVILISAPERSMLVDLPQRTLSEFYSGASYVKLPGVGGLEPTARKSHYSSSCVCDAGWTSVAVDCWERTSQDRACNKSHIDQQPQYRSHVVGDVSMRRQIGDDVDVDVDVMLLKMLLSCRCRGCCDVVEYVVMSL